MGRQMPGAEEKTNKADKHSPQLASGVCLVGSGLLRTQAEDSESTQVQYLSVPFTCGCSFEADVLHILLFSRP